MENESCNLYLEASASGIEVAWFPLSVEPSMAIQFKDTCAIALDPNHSGMDGRWHGSTGLSPSGIRRSLAHGLRRSALGLWLQGSIIVLAGGHGRSGAALILRPGGARSSFFFGRSPGAPAAGLVPDRMYPSRFIQFSRCLAYQPAKPPT